MNVKLAFVFTICVVIPNGLYMSDISDASAKYRKAVSDHFMTVDKHESGIYKDDFGNIFIRILVAPGSNRSGIFVPKVRAIGVYLYSSTRYGDSNVELVQYFAKMLDIRRNNILLLFGLRHQLKLLKVMRGTILIQDVLRKLVDRCIKTKRQS